MSRHFLTILSAFILSSTIVSAQEVTPKDVMRYNESDLNGTARFKAMSGAFGALGGDLSALRINPAGGAIFNYNTAAFSLSFVNKDNKSNYLGQKKSDDYNGLDLGQLGALFVFKSNNPNAVMKKFTIGLNYESTKNLRNNYIFQGTSNNNSLGDYFLQTANNSAIPFDAIAPTDYTYGYDRAGALYGYSGQQTYLAAHSNLISKTNKDGIYSGNYLTDTPMLQTRELYTTGYTGQFSGNFAAQLGDRFYVGANLNVHTVDYTQDSRATQVAGKEYIHYDNYLYTYGTGFSFNLGAIAQITNEFRAGLAYQSPTWYSLNDELTQGVATVLSEGTSSAVYPYIVNTYDKYKLRTPSKYTGSLAYVFGDKGLLSVDYTIKDYSNNEFRPKWDGTYALLNEIASNEMKTASELRIGGEYRIKQFSLRGGYRYEQSPYKNIKYVGDLNSFSLGLGYDFGASRVDISYAHTTRDSKTSLIDMPINNLYSNANIKSKENWINITYNINF